MQEESPTTQNKLLEEAYERAINGNRWKQIQEFLRSSQSSVQQEDQPFNQKQKYNEFQGVSKSQNGLIQNRENINGNSFANNYVVKRQIVKQTIQDNLQNQFPLDSESINQNYLKIIDSKKFNNFNPLVHSYQENLQSQQFLQTKKNEENKNIFDIQNQQMDKFNVKSEYDNKSLDTKSQITQLTDTVHSQKPNSQIGIHLQQKSFSNRRSFQKFKSPLLNQKEIDMHLKDINNQYVIESIKETKQINKKNEKKNQYKAQIQSSSKSSQHIDSSKDLQSKKQKLMTIQQNESQDMRKGSTGMESQNIQIQRQSMENYKYCQNNLIAEAVDQESLNAITSKYQSLKSYYGQNQGSSSNHKNAIPSEIDSNQELLKHNKIVREFDSKKNSDYYNRLSYNNKQKLNVQKKSQNIRNVNIKSSREETSFNRNKKQLQFDQEKNNNEPYEKLQNYSDNLSAYDLNKSNNFSQNYKDISYKKNNYQINSGISLSTKGKLLTTQKLVSNNFQNQEISRIKTPLRQKSTVSDNLSRKVQNCETVIQFLTEQDIKKELIESFQKIRLDVYSDILRIKKPQSQAYIAGQLLCKTVNSFRGGQNKHIGMDSKFQMWETVQEYVHKQPNVIKFNQEITQLIQHMILSKDYLNQIKSDQLKNHLKKISKIQQQFFGLKMKSEIVKQFMTNKNFQIIVNLCYCICRYVLYHSGRTNQINLKYEQLLNFDEFRSRSNIRSDQEKNSTQRSHISQTIGMKSETLSTNQIKDKNEFQQDQSELNLNQSISTKGMKRKSPLRIHDKMMIEPVNSLCTPKQAVIGIKNNVLQSRENKTDFRKSTIRQEDSFQGISKLKNFQYLNDSFQNSNKTNNKPSPIKVINQEMNIFQQNQLTAAQNYSFIQQAQNQNQYQLSKSKVEFNNNDIIFESKNEYNLKHKFQKNSEMNLESRRSYRSNKKLLQSSYYFTPQGKNISVQSRSDQKSSYQLNPKQVKKLKVFDRLSLIGVQRKKLQQKTLKNSPQKQNAFAQADEVLKMAADSVKLNIIPKQISEYQNDQAQINQNEKENIFIVPESIQGPSVILNKQVSSNSLNNGSISNSQEIVEQENKKTPNKFPHTSSNSLLNFYNQNQSLYNPSLIIQVKQETVKKVEVLKSNKQQIQFIQSVQKNNMEEEILNFSRQTADNQSSQVVNQIQTSTVKQRKSRQERSTGKKSISKQINPLLKNNINTFNPADFDIQNKNTLDEFVQIEINLDQHQNQQKNQNIFEYQNYSEQQFNIQQQDDQNIEINIDQSLNEIIEQFDKNKIENQEIINDEQDVQQEQEEPRTQEQQENIDIHYLQAYNSINDMPFQIFSNEQNQDDQVSSDDSDQENECYIDPIQEAQRIIGIIKAELDEDNEIPQIQQLMQAKADQTSQLLRSNSINQENDQQELNNQNRILHRKNQNQIDIKQDNLCDNQSQENTEKSFQQQSILDSKFQAMKKFKYLEILRNKKNVNSQKPQSQNNDAISDQASIQQKFQQNIISNDIIMNDEIIKNSNEQIKEPLTAEIPFQKIINQQEQMPFEQKSEKLSQDEENETRDQIQNENFDEYLEQRANENQIENKSSEENEQYYMQEIVSPFRKLRTSLMNAENNPQSPIQEDPAVTLQKIEWEINPVKIRRDSQEQEELPFEESKNEFQELNFDNEDQQYQNEEASEKDDEIISPGKLKSTVVESRKHIMERIDETQKEIEQNSPTRNSGVNIDMIQKLKERRIQKIKTQADADAFQLLQNSQI